MDDVPNALMDIVILTLLQEIIDESKQENQ